MNIIIYHSAIEKKPVDAKAKGYVPNLSEDVFWD